MYSWVTAIFSFKDNYNINTFFIAGYFINIHKEHQIEINNLWITHLISPTRPWLAWGRMALTLTWEKTRAQQCDILDFWYLVTFFAYCFYCSLYLGRKSQISFSVHSLSGPWSDLWCLNCSSDSSSFKRETELFAKQCINKVVWYFLLDLFSKKYFLLVIYGLWWTFNDKCRLNEPIFD